MSTITYSLIAAMVAGGVAADPFATITALPRATDAADLDKRIIGYSQTTTYETTSPLPLTDYYYAYSAVPYQVNPYPVERGPQSGYNQCNSTTEGPNSQCQTLEFNSLDDFCIYGAPGTNQLTGDIEAATVKYCTKAGHGGRIVPPGTFSGLQFMRTPAYIQITGNYDRTKIGLSADDTGGELDPHGADLLGNPLGALVYSKSLPSGDNTTYQQTQSWNQFFDGGVFCIKLCDPNWTGDDKNYCQNLLIRHEGGGSWDSIYDIIGCSYNMPAAYQDDVFLSCEGDLQDEVGTYTSDGQTITWSQPSSLSPSTTLPWKPRVPSSSNCMTYQSTDLFPASDLGYLANATSSGTSGSASASVTASGASGAAGANGLAASAGSISGNAGSASQTISSGGAAASVTRSGAAVRSVHGAGAGVGLMGLVWALFL